MNPEDLPQPPEGILDPKVPWSRINPNSRLWLILKARLTGRPQADGYSYSSYVNISEADADRLIANMKKDPRGYPSLDQESGTPSQWMERQRLYQEWLVEDYLEKPFREQTNKKIEEAELEARLREIDEQRKKDKESVPLPPITNEDEQEELDQDQEVLEDKIDDLTEDIDSELPEQEEQQEYIEPDKPEPEEESNTPDGIEAIKDSLSLIKGSLQTQVTDLQVINQNDSLSLSSLETLKKLFETQSSIFKDKIEEQETQQEEADLEQTKDVSGVQEATDLTADNKAEGIIQGVDGPVLTVKTTEGEFKQGEKISQGNTGGGFFDMLKGIAGKFLGGKGGGMFGKGGGASSAPPTKLSSGGFLNTPYPAPMAEGGLAPGIYDKPTRGNLGMNQMVIPLNRNVGKPFRQDKKNPELRKKDQPLIDVMSNLLKSVGLSIVAVAGNFLTALGPLGGFFSPYVTGLVKGLSKILGVAGTVVMSLLGGPAYAAMEDQDKQKNIFAELWNDLMEKFGFDLGGDGDDKKKKKKKEDGDTPSTATGKWGPLLDVIASGEGNYDSLNPSLKRPEIIDMTISELVAFQHESKAKHGGTAAAGRYQMLHPESYAQNAGLSMDEKFSPENQDKMAAAYIENVRGGKDWLAGKLTDEDFGKKLAMEWAALEYPGKGGGYYDGDGRNKAKVSWDKVKAVLPKVKAEEGVQIKVKDNSTTGKFLGWSIIEGPNSGYDVGPNLEMHGKEAYLQHENAVTILPIENNEYSLSKNPERTINRWKEILGPKPTSNADGGYARGGSLPAPGTSSGAVTMYRTPQRNTRSRTPLRSFRRTPRNFGADYKRQELMLAAKANGGSGLADIRGSQRPRANPFVPSSGRASQSSTPVTKAKPEPVKTETDLMMEQYNQLIAAGKHTEAKELGMQIWNKTWKKTDKGLERIPSTPITATAATKSQPTPIQQTTSTAFSGVSVVSSPPPAVTYSFPQMSDSRLEFKTIVERSFG